jgi:hypothetical protein
MDRMKKRKYELVDGDWIGSEVPEYNLPAPVVDGNCLGPVYPVSG